MDLTEDFILLKPKDLREFVQHRKVLESFSATPEGLTFYLGGVVHFEKPEAQDEAFNQIKTFVLVNFHRIPCEIYPMIQTSLFKDILETTRFQEDPGFRKSIHFLQAISMSNLYPEHWPSFWTDLWEMPSDIVTGFLSEFGEIMDQTRVSLTNSERVLDAMLKDNSLTILRKQF